MTQITLDEYSSLIHLRSPYASLQLNTMSKEKIVTELLELLLEEQSRDQKAAVLYDIKSNRHFLKGFLNIRKAKPLPSDFLTKLDNLLQSELLDKGIVRVDQLKSILELIPHCTYNHSNKFILWQGDIIRLGADAIVNAANKYMLGCFQYNHACIDNAIHSAAGPQLREDCRIIMSMQGEPENTGSAKITRGYNLPARYVLHYCRTYCS
ncbi:macro domain-containing protein [Paenibacillus sinopodophylli]|uniref:macro domain-containing protein n=1 Tax=Paenibacillus sinopodophylli TaxID=1837342 RepID=UPI002482C4FC|nr:macro domain-containing protein [Paenibacillus sinopodophylli]